MSYAVYRRKVRDESRALRSRYYNFKGCLMHFAFMSGESCRATLARLAAAHGWRPDTCPNEGQVLAAMLALDADREAALAVRREEGAANRAKKRNRQEAQRVASCLRRSPSH